ncbi:hypothetical protein LX36DRAFT_663792 [Colletotrichum falcatum]|nr:hypothetical protein LX36DRAFT_663792 [Colletotrichum falcatum]
MKTSVISSLIVALAGVLVIASPIPDDNDDCFLACKAQCDAEGKSSGHVECFGADPSTPSSCTCF